MWKVAGWSVRLCRVMLPVLFSFLIFEPGALGCCFCFLLRCGSRLLLRLTLAMELRCASPHAAAWHFLSRCGAHGCSGLLFLTFVPQPLRRLTAGTGHGNAMLSCSSFARNTGWRLSSNLLCSHLLASRVPSSLSGEDGPLSWWWWAAFSAAVSACWWLAAAVVVGGGWWLCRFGLLPCRLLLLGGAVRLAVCRAGCVVLLHG